MNLSSKILMLAISILLPALSYASEHEPFLVGNLEYSIRLNKRTGAYTAKASVERVQNPLYFDLYGTKVTFVVANRAYTPGKDLKVKVLASRNLGNISARTYFTTPISMSGKGRVALKNGRYRLCLAFVDKQKRLFDGYTFRKSLIVKRGKYNIKALSDALSSGTREIGNIIKVQGNDIR